MRCHRFYTPIDLTENTSVDLPPEATHHCVQVLRYKKDDTLTLFNGDGFNYQAKIETLNKKCCRVLPPL